MKKCFIFFTFIISIYLFHILFFPKKIVVLSADFPKDLSFNNSCLKTDNKSNLKYISMNPRSYFGKHSLMPFYSGISYSICIHARLNNEGNDKGIVKIIQGEELLTSFVITNSFWGEYIKKFEVNNHIIGGDDYLKILLDSNSNTVDINYIKIFIEPTFNFSFFK